MLGIDPGLSLADLEEPFVYVEHDKGGHVPYGYSFDECSSTEQFYSEFVDGYEDIEPLYEQGIRRSIERFERTIDELKSRNLLSRTLVVFTSDHGELLGESKYGGGFGHGPPICPELVTVPLVFLGADLPQNEQLTPAVSGVDVAATAIGALGRSTPNWMTGQDLWNDTPSSHHRSELWLERETRGKTFTPYKATSVWDENGGYVYHRGSRLQRLGVAAYNNYYREPYAKITRSQWPITAKWEFLRTYGSSVVEYGDPGGSFEEFAAHAPGPFDRGNQWSSFDEIENNEEALERMGYL